MYITSSKCITKICAKINPPLNTLTVQKKFADTLFQWLKLTIYFQAVTLPQTNVGTAYYSRKLNFYKLMLCEFGTNGGSCYCWTEDQPIKVPSDIAIGVCMWLKGVVQRVMRLRRWTCSPTPQCRKTEPEFCLPHSFTFSLTLPI